MEKNTYVPFIVHYFVYYAKVAFILKCVMNMWFLKYMGSVCTCDELIMDNVHDKIMSVLLECAQKQRRCGFNMG